MPRFPWLWSQGAVLLVPVLTLVALVGLAPVLAPLPRLAQLAIFTVIIVVAVLAFLTVQRHWGGTARLHRLAPVRAAWAAQHGWETAPNGAPDQDEVALALPRGWRADRAMLRLWREGPAGQSRIETWKLRAVPGSTRGTAYREVVSVPARTGPGRFAVTNRATIDPLLGPPAWVDGAREGWDAARTADDGHRQENSSGAVGGGAAGNPEEGYGAEAGARAAGASAESAPDWTRRVRDLVMAHQDTLLTVAVGAGRVVVCALDDPRPETAERRLALADAVAAAVGGEAEA
ncbi:hypothetical protein [Sediminivirga luteola]|uniref:hypothetical protein n=1 Tax=Sediminivirga luteola TaxID=1774748 RepID=UPI001668B55A|nr:hypothetical protein [Sediminivirga luteola]MCI2265506.1 hypothetical protein [Sediminivirga luteola]